ncbi:stage II sporulation protein M [Geomicrobium sp. JCM 19038]|uniref:stage II sporulation protein M n=1 Tax=Geomicrobium sp. JCM 19038 TaxID=1460635 RepID=UPI00045F2E26|nr:stage II sporulation protein M [Geomicrobium sp. JCM 19038]GAK07974.1 hypothetical protein JCM19038_1733 [Geomicrobium sp. JCM 19038]
MNQVFSKEVLKGTLYFFFLSILMILITFISVALISPDFNSLFNTLESSSTDSNISPWERFITYIANNGIYVPLQMLLFALIPIPFLYVINLASSSFSVGLALYLPVSIQSEELLFSDVLIGIVPHFIFEFLGFCIAASLLYQLNKTIIRSLTILFRNNKKENGSIVDNLKNFLKGYFILVLPILIFAAVVEAFITPLFL